MHGVQELSFAHDGEQRAPADRIDQEPANGGADCGREPDDQADDAHSGTAAFARERKKDERDDHCHEHARCHGLQNAADQQNAEHGREGGDQAADTEKRHAADEQRAGAEPAHESCRKGDDHRFGKGVGGNEPLNGGGVHLQVIHDGG